MLRYEKSPTEHQASSHSLGRSLDAARVILRETSDRYPALQTPSRAFGRLARAVRRPFRLAILGESNTGKTSLANLIAGGITLPAAPVANTRLPTLLQYAQAPSVHALYAGGERLAFSSAEDVQLENLIRLEVGLPSQTLRWLEILDFPGGANPLFPAAAPSMLQHGADCAIWATAATQAWRSSEQLAWMTLPARVRSRGLLAVTHCDLIPREEDFRRLRARLEMAAKPHFWGMCFVGAQCGRVADMAHSSGAPGVSYQIRQLAEQFLADRLEKAVTIARRVAGRTLDRLGLATD